MVTPQFFFIQVFLLNLLPYLVRERSLYLLYKEAGVGGVQHVDSPRAARVGAKHRAALVFVEHADSLT